MSKIELPELPASFCKGSPSLEAIGKTVGGLYSGDVMRAYAEAAVLAERERCADIAGRAWMAFESTRHAHQQLSTEPFSPHLFGFDMAVARYSDDIAQRINAGDQT